MVDTHLISPLLKSHEFEDLNYRLYGLSRLSNSLIYTLNVEQNREFECFVKINGEISLFLNTFEKNIKLQNINKEDDIWLREYNNIIYQYLNFISKNFIINNLGIKLSTKKENFKPGTIGSYFVGYLKSIPTWYLPNHLFQPSKNTNILLAIGNNVPGGLSKYEFHIWTYRPTHNYLDIYLINYGENIFEGFNQTEIQEISMFNIKNISLFKFQSLNNEWINILTKGLTNINDLPSRINSLDNTSFSKIDKNLPIYLWPIIFLIFLLLSLVLFWPFSD